MKIIDIKNHLHDKDVQEILSQSIYMPTEEKLNLCSSQYQSDESVSAFACIDEGVIIGIIIIKTLTINSFEILNLAVDPSFRGKGIGSSLISSFIKNISHGKIFAETDDDAVGFYRNYGFNIKALPEKYPNCIRYLCTLILP